MPSKPALLAIHIGDEAFRLGFELVGIVPVAPPDTVARYRAWLESNYHGDMAYLARPDAVAKREDLDSVLPGVRSVVVVGANYHVLPLPSSLRDDPARGVIASYAWGEDYHEVLLPRLHELAASLEARTGQPVASRAYVDTGPVLERDLAARAGLGFVGKNTNLIQPRLGSWLLLAELLLTMELPAHTSLRPATCLERRDPLPPAGQGSVAALAQQPEDQSHKQGTCGGCTRCLVACPTDAFVAPYVLDARRCISYLTIELKGPIPLELRPLIGNRIFGCEICQEVCPWNRRFARPRPEPAFRPGPD